MLKLTKAFALCGATDEAMALAEEVAFLQAVRAPLIKRGGGPGGASTDPDFALRQLLSEALVAEEVTDIFQLAGLSNPDVGIMSDQFLAEVRKMPQKNLAVELLQRLVKDALKTRFKTNLVQQKRFSEMLRASLNKYANRAVEAAQVIEELIAMAKLFREEQERGDALGLTSDEQSFYDALADNPSAQKLMQDQVLATMAKELAEMLRRDATIDWQFKENVRARLRVKIKTLLKRYKYPPDAQKKGPNHLTPLACSRSTRCHQPSARSRIWRESPLGWSRQRLGRFQRFSSTGGCDTELGSLQGRKNQ